MVYNTYRYTSQNTYTWLCKFVSVNIHMCVCVCIIHLHTHEIHMPYIYMAIDSYTQNIGILFLFKYQMSWKRLWLLGPL